jgi:hypothetical protein
VNEGEDGGLTGGMVVGRPTSGASGRHFHLGVLTGQRAFEGEAQAGDPPARAF